MQDFKKVLSGQFSIKLEKKPHFWPILAPLGSNSSKHAYIMHIFFRKLEKPQFRPILDPFPQKTAEYMKNYDFFHTSSEERNFKVTVQVKFEKFVKFEFETF